MQNNKIIESSELIVNPDGSIYHLNLKPDQLANKIILVGDPDRVEIVSSFFDKIEAKVHNREFVTHTGSYKNTRLSVISTGIGTDNVDIVINELDALVNIDLKERKIKEGHTGLEFVRIGTSGGLQDDIPVDSFLVSSKAIGFDGLLNFYKNRDEVSDLEFENEFKKSVSWDMKLASPYVVDSSPRLKKLMSGPEMLEGITISAPGFYGPQGRILRLELLDSLMNEKIQRFRYKGLRITNFEMESSAIYGLSKLLGHHAVTVCAIIANRANKTYSKDYHPVIEKLILTVLNKITSKPS
jgi:uridine phosphorylase